MIGDGPEEELDFEEMLGAQNIDDFRRHDMLSIWEYCHKLYKKMANDYPERIESDKVWPDVIIGIARGGWFPARLLCDMFAKYRIGTDDKGNKTIQVIHPHLLNVGMRRYRVGEGKKTKKEDWFQPILGQAKKDIKGKSVVVVDDVFDTGKSLELVLRHVEKAGPAELFAAVIDYKTSLEHLPIPEERKEERRQAERNVPKLVEKLYVAEKRNPHTWIIYPWEAIEESLGLYKDCESKNMVRDSLDGGSVPQSVRDLLFDHTRKYDRLKEELEAES